MKVLVGMEFSGRVRDAFITRGHDAISVCFEPSERPGPHIQDNVMNHLEGFDLGIFHPDCTYLCVSGNAWYSKDIRRNQAVEFVRELMKAPIEKMAIENPIGVLSTRIRKPDQIIQPYNFGHKESKATCLWLKNLPRLKPTKVVSGFIFPGTWLYWGDSKTRSRTFAGIAEAMANQWG